MRFFHSAHRGNCHQTRKMVFGAAKNTAAARVKYRRVVDRALAIYYTKSCCGVMKISALTLLLLAVGLSMDAFAVSISNGLCARKIQAKQAFQTAFAFGLAQGVMPLLGYLAGQTFSGAISFLDHWVALLLLGVIGGKMVVEAVREMRAPDSCPTSGVLTLRMLVLQAIATSIDALAVGIGFAVMNVNVWLASGFIACVTFVFSFAGVYIGKKSGAFLKTKAELAGGAILVLIGVKIFVEHMLG